jgi:TonB family protein
MRVIRALFVLLAGVPGIAGAAWTPCLAPGLEPPMPLSREAPPYPESARLANAEGSVELAFTVLRDGSVGWARILKAEPSGFFESAALDGVRGWRFSPALRDGAAVECRVQTRVRFTLSDAIAARPGLHDGMAAPEVDGQPGPAYPEAARLARLEGHVEVGFTVDSDGRVRHAEVRTAIPRGEFEAASLAAVRRWRFPPREQARELRRRFDFTLPDSPPRPPGAMLFAAAALPAEACSQRIGGWVRLEIDVDAQGRVQAARVVAAQPAALFDAAALAIARGSRVAPPWRDGAPVAATGLLTLEFSPDDARCPGEGRGDPRGPGRGAPAPRVS